LPLIEGDDFVATQTYTRSIYDVGSKFHVPEGARFTQMKFEFAPEALAAVLRVIAHETDKPILITENGVPIDNDEERVEHIGRALAALHQCIQDGIAVLGYFHWSAFDNFEWYFGYSKTFGLIAVDRQTMVRTPKASAHYYGRIARANALPPEAHAQPQPDAARELLHILRSEK
jgi:beta-glucosidase